MVGDIAMPMGAGTFRRGAMPYTLWMLQRIQDLYRALPAGERRAVQDWLAAQDAADALDLDIGVRLQRVGLHVRIVR